MATFEQMKKDGFTPSPVIYAAALHAHAANNDSRTADFLREVQSKKIRIGYTIYLELLEHFYTQHNWTMFETVALEFLSKPFDFHVHAFTTLSKGFTRLPQHYPLLFANLKHARVEPPISIFEECGEAYVSNGYFDRIPALLSHFESVHVSASAGMVHVSVSYHLSQNDAEKALEGFDSYVSEHRIPRHQTCTLLLQSKTISNTDKYRVFEQSKQWHVLLCEDYEAMFDVADEDGNTDMVYQLWMRVQKTGVEPTKVMVKCIWNASKNDPPVATVIKLQLSSMGYDVTNL